MTKEKKPRRGFFCFAAIAFLLIAVSRSSAQDGEKIRIRFGIHFVSSAGKSSSQFFDMTNGIINALKENYDFEVILNKYPSQEAVEEAFVKNKIDAAGQSCVRFF